METGKIRVLNEDVICKIAAGEVVERPVSVVKELVENSIDAGADKIEIEVKDGGHKLIEVTDNGEGITRQDATIAFTPHATSKISDDSDIENISSLGFRGEALAVIASVSRVTMLTKHQSEETATKIHLDGGRNMTVEKDSFPQGTRVQVRNLFFNVPARRKFLKSIQAEMAQISDIVCHYMMGYPEIAFSFTKNNIQIASTSGSGNLIDAILSVYGPEIAKNLKPLKYSLAEKSGISVRGYISPPNHARPSSRYMTTLVNRRYVKTKLVAQAISKAISAFFPKQRYPVLVLDLRLPASMIDVNVHPQKTEIRFKDERLIFSTVWETVQSSLSGLKLAAPLETEKKFATSIPQTQEQSEDKFVPVVGSSSLFAASIPEKTVEMSGLSVEKSYDLKEQVEKMGPYSNNNASAFETVTTLKEPRILAQLKRSYLLGEDNNGLFIIDQHAAHERILFDQLVSSWQNDPIAAQPLLFPIPLKLLPSEKVVLKEQKDQLMKLGFSFQQEEDDQIYITAVPVSQKNSSDTKSIETMLSGILQDFNSRSYVEIKTDLFKIMACKGAVKAGSKLDESEWQSLLEQLLKTDNPFTCPHGRPIVIRLTTRQIETGFMRS